MTGAPLAFAGDYPPSSDGEGRVEPSRIHGGECATFSGNGFLPHVTIAVTDNGADRGTATTTSKGGFAKELCYDYLTPAGRHVLRGTGQAPGKPASAARRMSLFAMTAAEAATVRTVTATLYVDGLAQSTPAQATGKGSSPSNLAGSTDETVAGDLSGAVAGATGSHNDVVTSLPRADVVVTPRSRLAFTGYPAVITVAVGAALIAVGSLVLVLAEQRHRRRRLA